MYTHCSLKTLVETKTQQTHLHWNTGGKIHMDMDSESNRSMMSLMMLTNTRSCNPFSFESCVSSLGVQCNSFNTLAVQFRLAKEMKVTNNHQLNQLHYTCAPVCACVCVCVCTRTYMCACMCVYRYIRHYTCVIQVVNLSNCNLLCLHFIILVKEILSHKTLYILNK